MSISRLFPALVLSTLSMQALSAGSIDGEVEQQALNPVAIVMFILFVAVTLGTSYWASKRTRSSKDFYTAGGEITGLQNGTAIAGDFMSAASFLGITGLLAVKAPHGRAIMGWPSAAGGQGSNLQSRRPLP